MEEPHGAICCDIMAWCKVVQGLSKEQRIRLASCNVGKAMLAMPPHKPSELLIKFLLEAYDPTTSRFIIQPRVGEITCRGVDVECLLGLQDGGIDPDEILKQEGDEIVDQIPERFLSKTGNLVMVDLVRQIKEFPKADQDFMRRIMLVLIGYVLAPRSTTVVYKPYYALVDSNYKVDRINWNRFTLSYLMEQLNKLKFGMGVRKWPLGNLCILEYMYWEKVKPQDEPALRNRPSAYPLMLNWTQTGVELREMYDEDNARGRGDVKIDDNITEQYREGLLSTPVTNRKSGVLGKNASTTKTAPRPRSNKKTITWEISMEIMMKKMMQELTKKIVDEVPKQCAKEVFLLLNKPGVRYNPAKGSSSQKNGFDNFDESYLNGPREAKSHHKDFPSNSKSDTPHIVEEKVEEKVEENGNLDDDAHYKTPKLRNMNDFIGDGTEKSPWEFVGQSKPASPSISFPSTAELCRRALMTNNGKRKRMAPKKLDDYMVSGNASKRAGRSKEAPNLDVYDIPQDTTYLSQELINAAKSFVELLCNDSKELADKEVYLNTNGEVVTTKRLSVIIAKKWLTDDVLDAYIADLSLRVGDDRHLCSAVRTMEMVQKHRNKQLGIYESSEKKKQNRKEPKKKGIKRVMEIYFVADKIYFPLNISNMHWVTVVMHIPKKEFQILDSLIVGSDVLDYVRALREKIADDVHEYNTCMDGTYPDVSTWDIKIIPMSKQTDGHSCGLWLLHCLEHWDGDQFTTEVNQRKIEASRALINAQIVLARTNILEIVKRRVVRMAATMKED